MKRSLLASTAVVGLGMLICQPVLADGHDDGNAITTGVDGASLRIRGKLQFSAGWRSATDVRPDRTAETPNNPSFDFREKLFLGFKGEIKDGDYRHGLIVEIKFRGDAGRSGGDALFVDEMRGYIRNPSFGSFEFGEDDGMSDNMTVYFPVVGFLQLDADSTAFLPVDNANGLGFLANEAYKVFNSEDATKVMYRSPSFEGFEFGISYAPQLGSNGNNFANTVSEYDNFIEAGLLFRTSEQSNVYLPEGVSALASFTFTSANYTGARTTSTAPRAREDLFEWGFGASLTGVLPDGGGEVTISGGIVDHDEDSRRYREEFSWNFGIGYKQGDVSTAFGYTQTSYDNKGSRMGDSAYSFGAGVAYQLATGLQLTADYITYEDDSNRSDGSVFILGTIVAF